MNLYVEEKPESCKSCHLCIREGDQWICYGKVGGHILCKGVQRYSSRTWKSCPLIELKKVPILEKEVLDRVSRLVTDPDIVSELVPTILRWLLHEGKTPSQIYLLKKTSYVKGEARHSFYINPRRTRLEIPILEC